MGDAKKENDDGPSPFDVFKQSNFEVDILSSTAPSRDSAKSKFQPKVKPRPQARGKTQTASAKLQPAPSSSQVKKESSVPAKAESSVPSKEELDDKLDVKVPDTVMKNAMDIDVKEVHMDVKMKTEMKDAPDLEVKEEPGMEVKDEPMSPELSSPTEDKVVREIDVYFTPCIDAESKVFGTVRNRENDREVLRVMYEGASRQERARLQQCGLGRATVAHQLNQDGANLAQLISRWDPHRAGFYFEGIGLLTITRLDIRRILGVSDSGQRVSLEGLKPSDGLTRGMAAGYLSGDRRALDVHGVDCAVILTSPRVPLVRKLIAMTILHRVSGSMNYGHVPCGWVRLIRACEAGRRFDFASYILQVLIQKLDLARRRGEAGLPYCTLLMGWMYDRFPILAPLTASPIGPEDPMVEQWRTRWRHGGGDMRGRRGLPQFTIDGVQRSDYVAYPYAGIAWESDADQTDEEVEPEPDEEEDVGSAGEEEGKDESEEEEAGAEQAGAAEMGGEAPIAVVPRRVVAPPQAEGAQTRGAAPGPQVPGGVPPAPAASGGQVQRHRRPFVRMPVGSTPSVDVPEGRDVDLEVLLAGIFPENLLTGLEGIMVPPPLEVGTSIERAARARDMIIVLRGEVMSLRGELRGMQARMSRSRSHRTSSHGVSVHSRHGVISGGSHHASPRISHHTSTSRAPSGTLLVSGRHISMPSGNPMQTGSDARAGQPGTRGEAEPSGPASQSAGGSSRVLPQRRPADETERDSAQRPKQS